MDDEESELPGADCVAVGDGKYAASLSPYHQV